MLLTLTFKAIAILFNVSVEVTTSSLDSNLDMIPLDTPDFLESSSCVNPFLILTSLILYCNLIAPFFFV